MSSRGSGKKERRSNSRERERNDTDDEGQSTRGEGGRSSRGGSRGGNGRSGGEGGRRVAKRRQDFSDGSLKRFTKRYLGKVRVSEDVSDELRKFAKMMIVTLTAQAQTYTEHAKRETIKVQDLEAAVKLLGEKIFIHDGDVAKRSTFADQSTGSRGRQSAGTVLLDLSPKAFRRIVDQEAGNTRISASYLANLQIFVEQKLSDLLNHASKLKEAYGSDRKTVQGRDVKSAAMGDCLWQKLKMM